MPKTEKQTKSKKTTVKKVLYYQAIGRRKKAICRVRLYLSVTGLKKLKVKKELKKGDFLVNWQNLNHYFPDDLRRRALLKPFELVDSLDRFITIATIKGSGKVSQLEALILAISRALQKVNPEYRPVLKAQGLLTVDARVRERRKVGMGGKARRKRQSPKR